MRDAARRWGLVTILLGGLAAGQPPAPPPDLGTRPAGADWPRFLGPLGTSVSSEKGVPRPLPKAGLRVVWKRPAGTGYGVPSISHGRAFFFDRHGDKARLTCLKSETGEELWRFEYPTQYEDAYGYNNGPRCCPVIDDDRVYVYGVEGMLHCLRVADGKPLWQVDTFKTFSVTPNFFGVGSTPAVEGDLLLAQVGGSTGWTKPLPDLDQKGSGSGVVAFDKYTGKVRYQVSDELASYSSPVLATLGGRRWCFVFARGGLLGLEPATGKMDFHFPWRARLAESVNAANPVVVGDRVLISETYGPGGALLEVKPGAAPAVVWSDADKGRAKSLQAHWTTPIHVDGYVYGDSGRHPETAEIRCVELATGKVTWREGDNGHVGLLLADGLFLALSEYGELIQFKPNPAKYEELARFDVFGLLYPGEGRAAAARKEYPWWAAPVLSHGLLYLRGAATLVCLELIPPGK